MDPTDCDRQTNFSFESALQSVFKTPRRYIKMTDLKTNSWKIGPNFTTVQAFHAYMTELHILLDGKQLNEMKPNQDK